MEYAVETEMDLKTVKY